MRKSQFKPGVSGNPKGRPKGSKNKRKRLMDALEKDLPDLITAAKVKALRGDVAALRLLLERLIPTKKSESSTVFIKNFDGAATLTEKADVIMTAIANGMIPPDVGASLITALNNTAKIVEIDDLMKRVAELERNDQK